MTRLLLVAAALVAVLAAAGVGAGATWDVYPGDSIQGAIDGAGAGDTIYVHAGTYDENVDVDKRITLIGDGADVVTVRAEDGSNYVFDVTADWVNITGFTVTGTTGSWDDGICLDRVNYCNISDNNASNNGGGIYMSDSNNNTLTNNIANSNSLYGILLYYSSDNMLTNNIANLNSGYGGIFLRSSSNNTLTNNIANSNNGCGIYLIDSSNNAFKNNILVNNGFSISDSYRNTVKNSTVNGKPLAYLEDISNFTIQNAGQVILVNCTNATVENLDLSNVSIGMELCGTNDCKIVNNNASLNSWYGIYLTGSRNNTLTNNTADSNKLYGIYMEDSSNNELINNNAASNNRVGIYLWHSSNNTPYHNDLSDNIILNACDNSGTNQWDSGSEGNYYSDYTGTDSGRDGIGDTTYPIPSGESIDRFPLMHPWTSGTPQKGDLNHDGNVTPADTAIVLQLAASGAHNDAADVSGDGSVTSLDALMILQAAAENMEL